MIEWAVSKVYNETARFLYFGRAGLKYQSDKRG